VKLVLKKDQPSANTTELLFKVHMTENFWLDYQEELSK